MKKTLAIEGMSCDHCVMAVTKELEAVDGVSAVKVDLASKSAELEAAGGVTDDALKKAVSDAGYTVTAVS